MAKDKKKKIIDEEEEVVENFVEEVEEIEEKEEKESKEDKEEKEEEEITLESTNESFDDSAYIKALEKMAEDDEPVDFLNDYEEDEMKKKQKKIEEDLKLNESDLDSSEKETNIDD